MARKEKKYHFIYKTTNLLSGKYYIGMHSTYDLNDGYMGSGKRLKRSLNKYGKENHKVEILEFLSSRNELKKREEEIVSLNEVAKEECMNLKVGGTGGFSIEQQKINAKKSHVKQKILKETNKEWSDKRSKNASESNKKAYKEGKREKKQVLDWTGLNHSEETKEKMSKVHLDKHNGERNSQFGTCWITKDSVNKKIKKEELNSYLETGWIKGRKIN